MAIIGFLFLFAFLIITSIYTLAFAWYIFPKYNIGGVENKLLDKLMVIFSIILIGFCWYGLFLNAPFQITLK